MKTSKSPENKEVTPSKKKLKQARLPFKLITDVSPKPDSPQPRKRKLSVPDAEPQTKVGKICKENDLDKELVVISDDEALGDTAPEKDVKIANPLVKLVDKARKKKLQRAKAQQKSKRKSKKTRNGSVGNANESDQSQHDDVEMVDVEVIIHEERSAKTSPIAEITSSKDGQQTCSETSALGQDKPEKPLLCEKETVSQINDIQSPTKQGDSKESISSIICLDESNSSCDIKAPASTDVPDLSCENNENVNSETKVSEMDNEPEIDAETVNNVRTTRNTAHSKLPKPTNDDTNSVESEKSSENDSSKTKADNLESQNNVTPKRSGRIKAKSNDEVANSKLDDSVTSSPITPKQTKSVSLDESMNDSTSIPANLTPKQLQKRLESAKKREEREKEKHEREKKKQQEKDERAKQRQEKEDQKKKEREDKEEAKRKEKEEKEEQKRKEREEKEKQKEIEKKLRELKEEEKRKEKENKEEQKKKEKEAREEEKRKRQEALELEKQEQELKKKKAAEAFVNFFVPKQRDKEQNSGPISKNSMLSSFTIKSDMRLAPTTRADLDQDKREALDQYIEKQESQELYLMSLKDGKVKPLSSGKTWPICDKDDDVMIVEDELPPMDGAGETISCEPDTPREKLRPKLLSFHDNRRPPYWGTWRKKSGRVKPRRPFGQDQKLLDYEVDSDDDWEEEQEGESLDGSVCGSDEDGERDDYEVDNEVFVPHGYLSDEEATVDEDDVLSLSPETQKARLKHLEDEFESEMRKPTEKLKPRMYGLLWEDGKGGKPDHCVEALWNYFQKFSMILNDPIPFLQPSKNPEEPEKKKIKKKKALAEGEEPSPKSERKRKAKPENKEGRKKMEPKKIVPNQPGINSFLFSKVKSTE